MVSYNFDVFLQFIVRTISMFWKRDKDTYNMYSFVPFYIIYKYNVIKNSYLVDTVNKKTVFFPVIGLNDIFSLLSRWV